MKKQVLVGVMLGLIVGGMMVVAEEPAINPVEVKTRRVTVYGTNPLKIGSTEMTEANLIAVKVGGTLPAVNGAAVTDLTAANITSGGVLGGQTLSNNTVALKAAAYLIDGATITYTPDTMIVYTPTGSAAHATVTVTITNLAPAYNGVASRMYIANSSASTCLLAFADSTCKGLNTTLSTGECGVVVNFGTTNQFRLIK